MKEFMNGIYALYVYLPLSGMGRTWRRFARKLKGKEGLLQQVKLPTVSWKECTSFRTVDLHEADKANGNIRISELAILNILAKGVEAGTNIFEIGTFDGRTSLNLAFLSPDTCQVHTLDLQPYMETEYALADGEEHMVEKEKSGGRIDSYRESHKDIVDKIHQHYGDSATFDFSSYYGTCSLIFVDGSHAYDYVISDTKQALKLLKKDGVIIWHDYGIWEDVTIALEEIEEKEGLGLKHIWGTSLVYYRTTSK